MCKRYLDASACCASQSYLVNGTRFNNNISFSSRAAAAHLSRVKKKKKRSPEQPDDFVITVADRDRG